MEVKILGTGPSEGVPAPLCDCNYCKENSRNRPSVLVQTDRRNVLLDASPDIRTQLHKNQVYSLSDIFLTHHHFDHSNGLRDIYNTTFRLEKIGIENEVEPEIREHLGRNFDVYCSPFTRRELESNIGYAIEGHGFDIHETEEDSTILGEIEVESFITEHSRGYIGFIVDDGDNKIVYNPDHGVLRSDCSFDDVDVLIYDASSFLGYDIHGPKSEFEDFIQNVKADKIVFTNVSEHIAQKTTKELRNLVNISNASIVEDNSWLL